MIAVHAEPGIGHNLPPLADQLAEETAPLRQRAEDLAASASRAAVTDEASAQKATLLAKLIKDHLKAIEDARDLRGRPFLESKRVVDAHFGSLATIVAVTDSRKTLTGGPLATVLGMIDKYRREQEAIAAAERRRLEALAQVARDEAAKLEAARGAAKSNDDAMDIEIAAGVAASQAETLQQQAAQTVAGPIDTGYGVKASARRVFTAEVTDLKKALAHCLKVDETAIRTAVEGIYARQVKAGVRELPGAMVHEDTRTVIR